MRRVLVVPEHQAIDLPEDTIGRILEWAPLGFDRVVDAAFGANLPVTSKVVASGAVIAGCASGAVTDPIVHFQNLLRAGVTIRAVMVHTMPASALEHAIRDVTTLLERRILTHPIAALYRLEQIHQAHQDLESGRLIGQILIAHT